MPKRIFFEKFPNTLHKRFRKPNIKNYFLGKLYFNKFI